MYPTQSPQNYYPVPQVNAVKIDIINPQAYGSQAGQAQAMMPYPQGQYYYNVPQQPVYEMPRQSAYTPQAPMPSQVAHSPVVMNQVKPQPVANTQPAVVMNQAPAPVQTQAPVVPPPVVAPVVNPAQTEASKLQKEPEGIDVASINSDLKSTDLEKQFEAIQKIAEIEQNSPEKASALLTEETFTSLGGILTKDNSNLPGPTQEQLALREKLQTGGSLSPEEQAKAEELSPREIAEMNKQYATYSSAVLLKKFRDEVAKDPEISFVPMSDLPLVSIVVENLKSNDNPLIREASISALNYLAKPQDKEVLNTLFNIAAQQDSDEYVQAAAKDGLASVAKLAA